MKSNESTVHVGIDIAKAKFDACLVGIGKPKHHEFANTPDGFAKLLRWVAHLAPDTERHFCMEATGSYHAALAEYLADAGSYVSVVNPRLTHHAALAAGAGNKTDPAEAFQLAEYSRKECPAPWRRATPEVRTLVALMRRLSSLKDLQSMEQNRRGDPSVVGQVEVLESLDKSIEFLDNEIKNLLKTIDDHINNNPDLKADRDLLKTIDGIGDLTAAWIIAELPDVKLIPSAKAAAAYAGFAPMEYRSGSSVRRKTRLSKRGSRYLRKALYMPAMCATRCNPAIKAFYDRLLANGKPKMVALAAAMRKLLMIAYGVLRSRKDFTYEPAQS